MDEHVTLSTQHFLQETSAMDSRGLKTLPRQELHGISQPGSYHIIYNITSRLYNRIWGEIILYLAP